MGVVNVWGGECLGGERLTIMTYIALIVFSGVSSFPASHCTGFKGSENTFRDAFQVMKDGLKYIIYCQLFCVT